MKDVNINEEYADKLKKQEIDGSDLTRLTVEELMEDGLPRGPAKKLVVAAARLWTCTAIHGVILAPAVSESDANTVRASDVLSVCGKHARRHLGGLDQLFRYMT